MKKQIDIRELMYNYCAFYEVIFAPEEILPDIILKKYGLLPLSDQELRSLEILEMKRLRREKVTLREIGRRFNMTDSGVYRRIQRAEALEKERGT